MKVCCTCKKNLFEFAFNRDKGKPDGLDIRCKECRKKPCKEQIEPPPFRVCNVCHVKKPINKFPKTHKRRDGKATRCNKCGAPSSRKWESWYKNFQIKQKLRNRRIRRQNKIKLIKILGWKCRHCGLIPGKEWPIECFDFHHKDPSKKKFNFSVIIPKVKAIKNLKEEIKNCIVLCANCHRREEVRIKKEKWSSHADHNNIGKHSRDAELRASRRFESIINGPADEMKQIAFQLAQR